MTDVDTCACCGKPTNRCETHHVNHRKGDNHPDNLSPRDRDCHMAHHRNERALDALEREEAMPEAVRVALRDRADD
jgi:hypothetical protein